MQKKLTKKIKFKKRQFFIKKKLLKFHFETIETSIGFIVNQLQNFKKIGIIKVGNKYI